MKRHIKIKLDYQRKKICPQPGTQITSKPRGRPPIFLEQVLNFLRAVRTKGGIVNIHVVRAATAALIKSNPLTSQHLQNFSMPRSWVTSVYKRMGYTRRAGTTTRPLVPQGLYDECRREFLEDINRKTLTGRSRDLVFPRNLSLILTRPHHLIYLLVSPHKEHDQFL